MFFWSSEDDEDECEEILDVYVLFACVFMKPTNANILTVAMCNM